MSNHSKPDYVEIECVAANRNDEGHIVTMDDDRLTYRSEYDGHTYTVELHLFTVEDYGDGTLYLTA